MKIAILGYGKMGKAIEKIALNRQHEIVLKIHRENQEQCNLQNLSQANEGLFYWPDLFRFPLCFKTRAST